MVTRGTRWRSWLRHCATSRKVAGLIPDSVTGIFHWHNPSGRIMIVGLTRSLTEMSTRNISWWVKAAGSWGWQPYHFQAYCSVILASTQIKTSSTFNYTHTHTQAHLREPFCSFKCQLHNLKVCNPFFNTLYNFITESAHTFIGLLEKQLNEIDGEQKVCIVLHGM